MLTEQKCLKQSECTSRRRALRRVRSPGAGYHLPPLLSFQGDSGTPTGGCQLGQLPSTAAVTNVLVLVLLSDRCPSSPQVCRAAGLNSARRKSRHGRAETSQLLLGFPNWKECQKEKQVPQPWPVRLSWWGVFRCTERFDSQPGHVPCFGFSPRLGCLREAADRFLSHMDVSLPLFFSLPLALEKKKRKNKYIAVSV